MTESPQKYYNSKHNSSSSSEEDSQIVQVIHKHSKPLHKKNVTIHPEMQSDGVQSRVDRMRGSQQRKLQPSNLPCSLSKQPHNNDQPCEFQVRYDALLDKFNSHLESVLRQKQESCRQLQKYRQHIDKTYKAMQKKYENKIHEDRVHYQKKLSEQDKKLKRKSEQYEYMLKAKNQCIATLYQRIQQVESQKISLIEDNTKILYEISSTSQYWPEGPHEDAAGRGPYKNSYQQLVKLYQFVLQENNSLKKQLYTKGREIVISHQVTTQDRNYKTGLKSANSPKRVNQQLNNFHRNRPQLEKAKKKKTQNKINASSSLNEGYNSNQCGKAQVTKCKNNGHLSTHTAHKK